MNKDSLLHRVRPRAHRMSPAEVLQKEKEVAREYDRIRGEANTDPLTGFLNLYGARAEFMKRLADMGRHHERSFGVVIVDLKNFKFLNDYLGHVAGDQILKMITEVMRSNSRDNDAFWRIGGDEFAWILEEKDAEALNKLLFEARRDRWGTGEVPGWLETVNSQIALKINGILKDTEYENQAEMDAGQLRAGAIFIDHAWINQLHEGVDFVEAIVECAKDKLMEVKMKDPSSRLWKQ